MTPRSIVGTPRLFQNNPPINLHRLDSVRFFPINGNLGWLAFPNIIFLWEFGVYLYFLFIDILSLFFVFYRENLVLLNLISRYVTTSE